MTARAIEAVESSTGGVRAVRIELEEAGGEEVVRTGPAGPGLRVDFDSHGRPIALEIQAGEEVERDRVDGVLDALGHPPLTDEERALLDSAL